MSTEAEWQEANSRYLSATLAWLRAIMEPLATPQQDQAIPLPAPAPMSQGSEEQRGALRGYFGRKQTAVADKAPLLLPRGTSTPEQRIADAVAAMQAAAEGTPPPALLILSQRLGLTSFEQQLLSLCIAMELDTGMPGLCAACQRDPSRPYPTFALGFALFESASWEALSPERPLRFWRLLEITQPGSQPLTTSALRADERIVNYCKGLNYVDDRLHAFVSPIGPSTPSPNLPLSHQESVKTIVNSVKSSAPDENPPIIQLLGVDTASKTLVAAESTLALGLHLYRLPGTLIPSQSADVETFCRLWERETRLLPLSLYVELEAAAGPSPMLPHFLERLQGVLFLDTRDSRSGLQHPTILMEINKPTTSEQAEVWESFLGSTGDNSAAQLAAQFDLGYGAIQEIAKRKTTDLWDACLAQTRPQLDILAQRIEPKATWDDFVLPPSETALLHQIADQLGHRNTVYEKWGFSRKMSRGLGVSALFAGDSGTGKTMAAEVIARQLRLNLYRIDLSAVVSKYIGETEKNLRRLFDAAEDGGAILFFDEADALFGKRTEVKDSHDRYANIEINYLLQRMESFGGLAILATNMKGSLDPAFMRRLRFIVSFSFPGPAERKLIWQKVFPTDMPRDALDYDRLARLHVTGGNIHSIALNAAFLAAQRQSAVTMPIILEAARAEYRKLERPINEADFRWQESAGSQPGKAAVQ